VSEDHLQVKSGPGVVTDAPEHQKTPEESEVVARLEIKRIEEEQRGKRMEYLESLEAGLSKLVEQWKQQYPRVESLHILDQVYIYRGLRRDEYLSIMGPGLPREKSDQAISDKCVLWPKREADWLQLPAGIPFSLSEAILAASGFQASDPIPVRL
jgi:hypothetical protein